MTSNPSLTYTGVPILTLLFPSVISDGLGTNDPLSMTGGSNVTITIVMIVLLNCIIFMYVSQL